MTILILGLLLFLGPHSVHIFAADWRRAQIGRIGESRWMLLYSLISAVGLALVVWGYGMSRADPVFMWFPPVWTRHLAALLMIPAFILLVAAYVPGNRIKATFGHPMVLGVKTWAVAHILANGRLSELVLFGAFLIWAMLSFRVSRQRDRAVGAPPAAGSTRADMVTVVIGFVVWLAFAGFLHTRLIGVPVFG